MKAEDENGASASGPTCCEWACNSRKTVPPAPVPPYLIAWKKERETRKKGETMVSQGQRQFGRPSDLT